MTIKISIILPVYNVEGYIARCLESIVHQTCNKNIECIIVDDCGKDKSIHIVKEFIGNYIGPVRFKILKHEYNRGLAAARNTGVDAAKGEFVMHVDSDDWLEPTALEILLKKQEDTNADIISGYAMRHTKEGELIMREPKYTNPREMTIRMIELNYDHVIWRRIFRRTLYTENGICAIEGVNIGEDHCTVPRLTFYAKVVASVENVVYHYNCTNENSYMNSYYGKSFKYDKYCSDGKAIQILYDFFMDKDKDILRHLCKVRDTYFQNYKRLAALTCDKSAWDAICNDEGEKSSVIMFYIFLVLQNIKFYIKELLIKVFGRNICFKLRNIKNSV